MPLALIINDSTNYYVEEDANDAMRAYWTAKQSGRQAELKRVDCIPASPDDDPDPEAPVPGAVSHLALERIRRHEESLRERGIALPPPIYAPGTEVVQLGNDNFRTSRQAWEDMPLTVDGLAEVQRAVRSEDRQDFTVRVRDLRMQDDGILQFGEGPLHLEEQGLRALVTRNSEVLPRAGELVATLAADLRAEVLNRQLAQVSNDKRLKLRTRVARGGQRQVYAVVSERYAAFDADEVAGTLAGALVGSGMRGEVVYDSRTTSFRADGILHADEVVDLAAGDVFKLGVQFRSNDAAGGSIVGRAIAWRNLCLNLIIIGTGETELLRRRHIGDVADVLSDAQTAATQAGTLFADFAAEWSVLRRTKATDVFDVETMEDAVAELALMGGLDVGVRRDALVEMLLSGWRTEPGETLADLVNSVSAAHLLQEVDDWQRQRFEAAAGALVPVLRQRAEARRRWDR